MADDGGDSTLRHETRLIQAGRLQARLCHEHGSPTYGTIVDDLVDTLERGDGSEVHQLLLSDDRDAVGSALYLRLLGAVHRLVLLDADCPLRRWYPSVGGTVDPQRAAAELPGVVAGNHTWVEREMRRDVQTNDVGRIAPLSAAMRHAVHEFGGPPVQLLEPGTSAGLNLWPDRYGVEVDGRWMGPEDSALTLCGRFVEGHPPTDPLLVDGRRGCDLHPIAIAKEEDRALLRSFVWTDDTQRLSRLDGALATAGPVEIDEQDACEWLSSRLQELPDDTTTIVFHSLLLTYLSNDQRIRFAQLIRSAGATADGRHRLAWISLEPRHDDLDVALVCELWPGGHRTQLARCSPHGAGVRWRPKPLGRDRSEAVVEDSTPVDVVPR